MRAVTAEARSIIEGRETDLLRIGAEHVPFLAQVDLRVDLADVGGSPIALPIEPNTVTEGGDRAALWLGPDEWLILGPPATAPTIVRELDAALAPALRSVVDVSANRVAIELVAPDRLELLSYVCPLDLDAPAWQTGRCAQTLLGAAQVILHERASSTGILARPSFASYVIDLLLAAREASGGMRA